MDIEPFETEETIIKCDGGSESLGHPIVYLNLGNKGQVTCPYCSNFYIHIKSKEL